MDENKLNENELEEVNGGCLRPRPEGRTAQFRLQPLFASQGMADRAMPTFDGGDKGDKTDAPDEGVIKGLFEGMAGNPKTLIHGCMD